MADLSPVGHDAVINALIDWGRSGLIPNTKVIKSFHPPVQDPVTGVDVLMPATTYETKDTTRSGGPNGDYIIPGLVYKDKPVTWQGLMRKNIDMPVDVLAVSKNTDTPPDPNINHLGYPLLVSGLGEMNHTLSGSAAGTNYVYPLLAGTTGGTLLNDPGATVTTNVYSKAMQVPIKLTISSASAVSGPVTGASSSGYFALRSATANSTSIGTLAPATGGTGTYLTGVVGAGEGAVLSIDNLSHAPMAGSAVQDFNVNTYPGDMDTATAIRFTKNAYVYEQAVTNSTSEEEYQENIKEGYVDTVADRMTRDIRFSHPMITDNLADAKQMFSTDFLGYNKDPQNRTITPGRAYIPQRYDLVPTKVPCAIPGVLNCYMIAYDSVDVTEPDYRYTAPNIIMTYAPDSLKKEEFWVESYAGNGVKKAFTLTHTDILYPYALRVVVDETELAYNADWTTTAPGGVFTVTFVTAPSAGSSVKIGYDPSIMYKAYNDFDIPSTGSLSGAGDYYVNLGRRF